MSGVVSGIGAVLACVTSCCHWPAWSASIWLRLCSVARCAAIWAWTSAGWPGWSAAWDREASWAFAVLSAALFCWRFCHAAICEERIERWLSR